MTSKFREALDEYKNADDSWCYAELFCEHGDTIRQALLIAERLESGDVSKEMLIAGSCSDMNGGTSRSKFKAMAKVMIEEVQDNG